MGIAENLVQGFANAAGATDASQAIENKKSDRRATAHEELEANTHSILDDVKKLQQRRAALDPKSPTYAKDVAEIDSNLHQARQAFTDLYHPEKNPGALAKFGGFLKSHSAKQQADRAMDYGTPNVPTTPGDAKKRFDMAGLDAAAAGPGQTPENPYLTRQRQSTEAGGTPDEVRRATFGTEKAEPESWKLVDVTMPDGSVKTVQHNEKNREFADLAGKPIPSDQLAGAKLNPKTSAHPVRAWVSRNGKPTSVLLDPATNKVIPGSENPDIQPPPSMAGRITTGYYHFVDENGNVHQVQETRTSTPMGGANVPKTPGEAKTKAAATSPDNVIGHKETAVQAKAHRDYIDAVGLAKKADEVAKNPNDAVNQKRLAVALERVAAGRFTTQALDYIVKAGWGNTIEGWANSSTTGALPKDVMRQLIDGAHQEMDAKKTAWDESKKGGSEASGDADIDAIVKALKNK
jgi:hypothetical protein